MSSSTDKYGKKFEEESGALKTDTKFIKKHIQSKQDLNHKVPFRDTILQTLLNKY